MEVPIFASKLGAGQWVGVKYVIHKCPVCSGKDTLMFTGAGMWGCSNCHKGGMDLRSFRTYLADKPMMESIIPSIVDPVAPDELVVISEYKTPFAGKVIATGFQAIDQMLGGLTEGAMTVITGRPGQGKSTFLGQIALNAINNHHNVCFYSGELSTGRFQSWLFSQAAGAGNMHSLLDPFGAERWIVNEDAEVKIRAWLDKKLVLYDNTRSKASERKTILGAFNKARSFYGSDLFFVDNLMTAKFDIDVDTDANRAAANFASSMLDFARTNNVHVVLVAHPRKGIEGEDILESVAGLMDTVNIATNLLQIKRTTEKDRQEWGQCDALVTIAKNRELGDTGTTPFTFDKKSRRYFPIDGKSIYRYEWEGK